MNRGMLSKSDILHMCLDKGCGNGVVQSAIIALDGDIQSRARGLFRKYHRRMKCLEFDDLISIG